MRKLILLLSIISTLNSCYEPFYGNGVFVDDERQIPTPCYIIRYNTIGKLYVIQSDEYKLIVKTDENILPQLEIFNNGSRLVIDSKTNIAPTKLEFYVYLPDISAIEMNGTGDVFIDNPINQGKSGFYLTLNGTGNFNMDKITTDDVEIKLNGSGNVNIDEMVIQSKFSIKLGGSGNINIGVLQVPDVIINSLGSGNIDFSSGNVTNFNLGLYGSGNVNSIECKADFANILSEGSGDVYIWVINSLTAVLKGSGNVYYKGNPTINATVTGSGSLKKY